MSTLCIHWVAPVGRGRLEITLPLGDIKERDYTQFVPNQQWIRYMAAVVGFGP